MKLMPLALGAVFIVMGIILTVAVTGCTHTQQPSAGLRLVELRGCGSWSDRSRCRGWSRSRDSTNHSQSIIHEPDAAIAAGLRPVDLPRHSSVARSLCACGNSGGQQSQLRDTARRVLVAARWRHLHRLLIGIAQSSPLATIRCLRRQFGRWYAFEMSGEQFELSGLTLALAGLVALYQLLD